MVLSITCGFLGTLAFTRMPPPGSSKLPWSEFRTSHENRMKIHFLPSVFAVSSLRTLVLAPLSCTTCATKAVECRLAGTRSRQCNKLRLKVVWRLTKKQQQQQK
eukprot:1995574-Amphidinium_carterae.1